MLAYCASSANNRSWSSVFTSPGQPQLNDVARLTHEGGHWVTISFAETKVWDLIKLMQNVLNHVSGRLSHLTGKRRKYIFLCFWSILVVSDESLRLWSQRRIKWRTVNETGIEACVRAFCRRRICYLSPPSCRCTTAAPDIDSSSRVQQSLDRFSCTCVTSKHHGGVSICCFDIDMVLPDTYLRLLRNAWLGGGLQSV